MLHSSTTPSFNLVKEGVLSWYMKYLGIDYGEKRIGVAVSDAQGRAAFPKKVVFNRGNPQMMAQLQALVKDEHVSRIVVGLPIGLNSEETSQTSATREFADALRDAAGILVEFENEMLTTHMVQGAGIPREHTDEAAATVILQSYLDRQNSKS